VVDDLSTGSIDNIRPFLENPDFHFDHADLLTWDKLDRVAAWADRVYHLAAVVGVYRVLAEPTKVLAVNIAAFERLLRAVNPPAGSRSWCWPRARRSTATTTTSCCARSRTW
jgi:UDP-glucose 4-epimerase